MINLFGRAKAIPFHSAILLVMAAVAFAFAMRPAVAAETFKMCSSGTITLGSFKDHIAEIRKSSRYGKAGIDDLVKRERQGGAEFFSSQIVIKEEQSGSGDFDLNLFQGYSDPNAKYQSVLKWNCNGSDYPVAYFVGFKVSEIRDGAIFVSRAKGIVNVISLKDLDPDLNKHTKVRVFGAGAVLCDDIGAGCVKTIFYGRY